MTVTVNTWADVDDVSALTGITVPLEDVQAAQTIIELVAHRVWRETDSTKRDHYWLQRAVAYQAVYVNQHPEIMTMMGIQTLSQDGMSFTVPQGTKIYLAPLALLALNNLFRGSDTTIRFNSAFQRNRLRRVGYGLGATVPWSDI